jgi:hypothetical protein
MLTFSVSQNVFPGMYPVTISGIRIIHLIGVNMYSFWGSQLPSARLRIILI